ncbi:glycosyltransferase family 1 protein [Asaia sp. HN010]|uniref:glycosyltransferase family 4 protein n=1 Tax=Asaia sp. HN010 TaxID=3081233 RepID=UPI00301A7864
MSSFLVPMRPFYTLDISRLLSRAKALVPTGIDRVELEYARYLLREAPERLEFAAMHPLGRFSAVPFSAAAEFIVSIGAFWDRGTSTETAVSRLAARLQSRILMPKLARRDARQPAASQARVYLHVSHHHLVRPAVIETAIKRRPGTLFVPMVHDLIPLEYPEYSRPREPARHKRRIDTVLRYADAILTPSRAVRASLERYVNLTDRENLPVWSVPHGVHLKAFESEVSAAEMRGEATEMPYFIYLSTIEARKNHLLLLNIWRRLIETHGDTAPRLIIIGKRGWENEQVLDMLERCPALKGVVQEHNALSDTEVVRLLRGARALLFPSFTEGFGLPLAEALALGTPVLCSDIPVFREIGGDVVRYIDPLDGLTWMRQIEALSKKSVEEARSSVSTAPSLVVDWPNSVGMALDHIESFAVQSHPGR